jgi:hypothetical protein
MTKLAPHPGPGEPGVGRAVGVVRAPLTRRSRGRGGLRISRAPLRVAFWARGETGAAFGGTRRQQSRLGPRRGAAVGPCGPPVRRQHQGKTMPVEVSGPQRASGEAWRGSSLVEVLEERRRGPRKREDLARAPCAGERALRPRGVPQGAPGAGILGKAVAPVRNLEAEGVRGFPDSGQQRTGASDVSPSERLSARRSSGATGSPFGTWPDRRQTMRRSRARRRPAPAGSPLGTAWGDLSEGDVQLRCGV